jgi:alpha/beta superfamily hydrolase
VTGRLRSVQFEGPAGTIEGLWKDADGGRRGSAVFAHPHPLHGGTMHNKVVYRAAQALTRAGWATLRFNFRGVGLSGGRYDEGRGEVDDFRAALDEAERESGLPVVAGGFSFGAAVALKAAAGDARIAALIVLGLPLATESGRLVPRPAVPAFYSVGERDAFAPAEEVRRFAGPDAAVAVFPGADHFFNGSLDALGETIFRFVSSLPQGGEARAEAVP